MDTHPIVRKTDEQAHDSYRTKDTILAISTSSSSSSWDAARAIQPESSLPEWQCQGERTTQSLGKGLGQPLTALVRLKNSCPAQQLMKKPIQPIDGLTVLEGGDFHPADAVISNAGLGTYLKLLTDDAASAIAVKTRNAFGRLPLQSPGVCVYLAVKGPVNPPYLRFRLRDEPDGCRLLDHRDGHGRSARTGIRS